MVKDCQGNDVGFDVCEDLARRLFEMEKRYYFRQEFCKQLLSDIETSMMFGSPKIQE